MLWGRNRQGGGVGPGARTRSRPSQRTQGPGGVVGASCPPHLQSWTARGLAVLRMRQAYPVRGPVLTEGKMGLRRELLPGGPAPCVRSYVCPGQCLILLPLASVCLDSTKRRPWGGGLALWRRQRWNLGLPQPYQHLPKGLADRWHLLAFAPTRWLLSLRGLCV